MMQVYVVESDGRKIQLTIPDEPMANGVGGGGSIYRVSDRRYPDTVAKIYHSVDRCDRPKLEYMLANPPEDLRAEVRGEHLPVIAWPFRLLENSQGWAIGFLMPVVDTARAYLLYAYIHNIGDLSPEDQSIALRVPVARNLASVLAKLHQRGDYVIDLKAQNLFVFRNSGIVCLIDTDGCAIGKGRFPAPQYSEQYRAPEVLLNNVTPSALSANDYHDRFTLAVLIFQILNLGTHPYSGVQRDMDIEAGSVEDKVKRGWYAYGLAPHPEITPSPHSIHEYFDPDTRRLFDRAFLASCPSERPQAAEWVTHLDDLIHRKFERCTLHPTDVRHAHFKGKSCFVCEVLIRKEAMVDSPPPRPPVSPQVQPPLPPPPKKNLAARIAVAALVVAVFLGLLVSLAGHESAAPINVEEASPQAAVATPRPTAVIPPAPVKLSEAELEAMRQAKQALIALRHAQERSGYKAITQEDDLFILNEGWAWKIDINLYPGSDYIIGAVCNGRCAEMNLWLFDGNGNRVAGDTAGGPRPVIAFRPQAPGPYLLEVDMVACAIAPCAAGVAVAAE